MERERSTASLDGTGLLLVVIAAASVLWWGFAGAWELARSVAFVGVSLLCASVGFLAGFLFSAHEGEQASIGKVRDWLIGAISGIALLKAAGDSDDIYRFFAQFQPNDGSDLDVALLIATGVTYFTVGFFLMYVFRELQLNPALRAARTANEIAKDTNVQTDASAKAEKVPETAKQESLEPQAKKLLNAVEEKNLAPQQLSFEALVQTASAYFARSDYASALPYIRQAHRLKPKDAQVATLLGTSLAETGRRSEGLQILRRLAQRGQNVPDVHKILGYYLLWLPDELEEAVQHSMEYLTSVPGDSGAIFNLACAYAQLYGYRSKSMYRDLAIAELKRAIAMNPAWKERVRELLDFDFASLRNDPELRALVDRTAPPASGEVPVAQ